MCICILSSKCIYEQIKVNIILVGKNVIQRNFIKLVDWKLIYWSCIKLFFFYQWYVLLQNMINLYLRLALVFLFFCALEIFFAVLCYIQVINWKCKAIYCLGCRLVLRRTSTLRAAYLSTCIYVRIITKQRLKQGNPSMEIPTDTNIDNSMFKVRKKTIAMTWKELLKNLRRNY